MMRADAAGLQICTTPSETPEFRRSSTFTRKSRKTTAAAIAAGASSTPAHGGQRLRPLCALHVIASVQPYHAIDDGRWAESRIGPTARAAPMPSVIP